MKKKITIAVIALAVVLSFVVGGTLAWLVDSTNQVKNTFTYGDINIDLWEHPIGNDGYTLNTTAEVVRGEQTGFKMIPGNTIDKDPTVTVKGGSEASWLFIEVTESINFDEFLCYAIADGWTLYDETITGANINTVEKDTYVIYRAVAATENDMDFNILDSGTYTEGSNTYAWSEKEVFVRSSVNKEMLNVDDFIKPTLTFTAYAVQKDTNIDTVAKAWAIAKLDSATN